MRRGGAAALLCSLVGMVGAAALSGCGGARFGGGDDPFPSTMASKCQVGASQTSVLVTEWSAPEKANLEAMMLSNGGAVAVAFSGCQMRLIPECRLRGAYAWSRTTPTSDTLEIKNEAELYTKLPLGAVSLAGELKRSGTLYVETTVSGQRRFGGMTAEEVPIGGACEDATHIVSGMSLGAFALSAVGSSSGSASAEVTSVGQLGGSRARSGHLVRSAGLAASCGNANDLGPDGNCASPLQVFLSPIPGRAEEQGPVGTVPVDFVSGSATSRWDVYVDDQATCTTPCSVWVNPEAPVVLKTREDNQRLRLSRLDRDRGPLQVAAYPRHNGMFSGGIVATSFGGMALISGIALTPIGCSDEDRAGMCTAGLITMGAGAIVTAGGIWLMLSSGARSEVRPLFQGTFGSIDAVGPGYVAGRF